MLELIVLPRGRGKDAAASKANVFFNRCRQSLPAGEEHPPPQTSYEEGAGHRCKR